MSLAAHISMLKDKHLKLDEMIEAESRRPAADFTVVQSLKRQKLHVKEELERITATEMVKRRDGAA